MTSFFSDPLATLSTIADNSSVTLWSMTFIDLPGMSQVTSAIPSASTSNLKLGISGSLVHLRIIFSENRFPLFGTMR